MSEANLRAELEALRAENANLVKQAKKNVRIKKGEKGGVVVDLGGRFPVTLYKEQWQKFFAHEEEIRQFASDNAAECARRQAIAYPPKS